MADKIVEEIPGYLYECIYNYEGWSKTFHLTIPIPDGNDTGEADCGRLAMEYCKRVKNFRELKFVGRVRIAVGKVGFCDEA